MRNYVNIRFRSLYPSILLEFNIAPNTQLGKIIIPNKIFEDENHYNSTKYERAGEFIENLTTDNIIEFCHRWFGLANFEELLDDMCEYYNKFVTPVSREGTYRMFYRNDDNKVIQVPVKRTNNKKVISPITYLEEGQRAINPIIVLDKLPSKGVTYNGYYAGLD